MTRVCNKCGADKNLEDFPVQKGCLEGRRPTCKVCMALKTALWRAQDPDRAKQSQQAVKERNPENWYAKERARTKRYKEKHRDKVRAASRLYSSNNPHISARHYEKNRDKVIARSAEWVEKNPEKARVNSLRNANKRRAVKLRAMPKWANEVEIDWIYKMAIAIREHTGVDMDVDHIIPLQGKRVCGLHVADNLQIIESSRNRQKHNKFDSEAYCAE